MKLLLFDIDGIIVKYGEGHINAFKVGLKKVYGKEYDPKYDLPGMTDKQIIYEELKAHGLSDDDIKLKLEECKQVMVDTFRNFKNNLVAIDGVKEFLKHSENNKDILIGLCCFSLVLRLVY